MSFLSVIMSHSTLWLILNNFEWTTRLKYHYIKRKYHENNAYLKSPHLPKKKQSRIRPCIRTCLRVIIYSVFLVVVFVRRPLFVILFSWLNSEVYTRNGNDFQKILILNLLAILVCIRFNFSIGYVVIFQNLTFMTYFEICYCYHTNTL